MTKKERIQAVIRGEKPDKIPYSFWSHMPGTDLDPEAIAEKTYEFYKKYDFDKPAQSRTKSSLNTKNCSNIQSFSNNSSKRIF